MIVICPCHLTEPTRGRVMSFVRVREISVQFAPFNILVGLCVVVIGVPSSSLDAPMYYTDVSNRSYWVLGQGQLPGYVGYWVGDDTPAKKDC